MSCFYYIFLQTAVDRQAILVICAGALIAFLSLVVIFQSVVNSLKKNRLLLQQQLQEERFDSRLMENRLQVQADTFDSIGKELHDNVGQLISTAKMLIGVTETELDIPPASLLFANATLDRAAAELRGMSKLFDRESMESFDLFDELKPTISEINAGEKMVVEVYTSRQLLPIDPTKQFTLLRIIQEVIQNFLKHSAAKKLTISFVTDDHTLLVKLEDDGNGFDAEKHTNGLGLKNMRDRARLLNGSIDFLSTHPGTTIHIKIPLEKYSS